MEERGEHIVDTYPAACGMRMRWARRNILRRDISQSGSWSKLTGLPKKTWAIFWTLLYCNVSSLLVMDVVLPTVSWCAVTKNGAVKEIPAWLL